MWPPIFEKLLSNGAPVDVVIEVVKFENGIVVVVVVIVGAVVVVVLVEVDVGKGVTTIIGAALRPAVDATNDDVLVEEIVVEAQ